MFFLVCSQLGNNIIIINLQKFPGGMTIPLNLSPDNLGLEVSEVWLTWLRWKEAGSITVMRPSESLGL